MLSEDPRNQPVLEAIQDRSNYINVLRAVLAYVDYLEGQPHPNLGSLFDGGSWIPCMSKVRYGLLCVALTNPEMESCYHSFCAAVNDKSVNLQNFAVKTRLTDIRQLFVSELERYT